MRWSCFLLGVLLCAPLDAQEWVVLPPDSVQIEPGGKAVVQDDGSVLVEAAPGLTRFRVECPLDMEAVGALRIETLAHESLPGQGPGHDLEGNYALSELRVRSVVGRGSRWITLLNPTASDSGVGWPAGAAIDARENTAWSPGPGRGPQELVVQFEEVLGRGRRTLVLDLEFNTGASRSLGCFRISASGDQNSSAKGEAAAWGKTQIGINNAIDKGVQFLLNEQELDGSWADQQDRYVTGGTALAVYALMKSGVPKNHQAVRRALAYLQARPPRYTYEAGTQLMAFVAADKERWKDHAAGILDELLDWQVGDWGYPGSHGNPSAGHRDLSNTQYGALGLWAATQLGLEVPPPAWERLAGRVMNYQTSEGGFGYGPGGGATGSMSAAGVTVLSLCLPHLSGGLAREVEVAQRSGLGWLDRNFSPTTNLGHQNNAWFHYYMYGIERVGAFAEVETLNGQNWYRDGARQIIKQQTGKGNWGDPWGRTHSTTSYCLLFLNRASSPSSGPGGGRSAVTYGDDNPETDISLRAAGDSPITLWVSSFGDKLMDKYVFEGEEGVGLRVARVDYLTDGGVLLADSRQGGTEWVYTTKAPGDGWARPGFDTRGWKSGLGAFGRKDSKRLAVGTSWKSPGLWLRKELKLEPDELTDPKLMFNFGSGAGDAEVQGTLLKIYDEEEGFGELLTGGSGQVQDKNGDAASGERYLHVTPRQRETLRIPGWGFPIRAKPTEGEYRFIQFAWRKPENNVMIQLSMDGNWGQAVRYFAGKNQVSFNPAIQITAKAPTRWTVVTRDLWRDLGRDGRLTGLALTAMDGGPADFDSIYLARSKSDFRHARDLASGSPEWELSKDKGRQPAEDGAFALYINGELAFEGDWETGGFEPILGSAELRELLVAGRNLIAVHAKNSPAGRSVDLSLLDAKRLASVDGNPTKAQRGERYAARLRMPRPGQYDVWARVHLLDEVTGESVAIDSQPLALDITAALDPEMLDYATDSTRNLMAGKVESVEASSAQPGWEATRAVDNNQVRSWVSQDGDRAPELRIELTRPVRADVILLSPTRILREHPSRHNLASRVEITLNGRGSPLIATLRPGRLTKTPVYLGKPQKLRSLSIRIVGQTEGTEPGLTGVGFAEVELQLKGR